MRGDRAAVRGSGPGRMVHDRRRSREADGARTPARRRAHAVGRVGGPHERAPRRRLHRRRPLAGHRRSRALHPPRGLVGATDLAERCAARARFSHRRRARGGRGVARDGRGDRGRAAPLRPPADVPAEQSPGRELPEGEALAALAALAPIVEGKRPLRGRSTAYVCERGHCQLPTSDPAVLRRQLARLGAYHPEAPK